jgi:hypothetical protein
MRRILVSLVALVLFAATPASAQWHRAESPNFIVYGEMSQGRLRERIVLLEEFDAFLRSLTGTTAAPSPNKLRIYLVRGPEMQTVAPVGPNVGGFYRATPEGVAAVADVSRNWQNDGDDSLLHEYAHHFMMQYHPAPYPAWYVEGFAEYVMTANIRAERIEYGNYNALRALWLTLGPSWTPYDQILFADKPVDAPAFYSQSWLLVHYIMADAGRRAAFVRYVQALARGEETRAAFHTAFAMGPADVDRALRDYARRITFHRITRSGRPAPPPIVITRLADAALNPPLIEAALLLGAAEPQQRRGLLERARRAGNGDDAYGRRVQARAEILYGDLAAADRLLDALLAMSPADAELLYLKGLRNLVAGHRDRAGRAAWYRTAQGFFGRAVRADPNHVAALFRYAESLSGGERLLAENTRNVLLLATSLAPQVSEIRLAAAHVLLLRGEFTEAEALLLPMTPTAHESEGADRAQEFLRLARARQRPADTAVFKVPDTAPAG